MSEIASDDNNKISANIHHSLVDMDDTGGQNLLPDGKTEDDYYSSNGRKQKRHIHRGKKKLHRRRKSKKKFHTSTEISYSFPSLNDTYERLRKIDVIVNNTETTKASGTLESSTVHKTDNEELNEEFGTSESLQQPHETMDEDLDKASGTYESSTLKHYKTNQEDSYKVSTSSKSSTLQHKTTSKNSKSSPNIFEVELNDIIENDKELDESFSIIEETTTLTSHVPNKSEETSATADFNIQNMDNAPSSSEDFSLGDEKTFLPSEYQIDIMKQLVTLTEYPPTKQKKLKDQAVKRSEEHIYPLNSKNRKMTNVNNENPHPVHSTRVEYEEVDSTKPVSSFDNSDYGNVDDEDYIDIQLPFEKPHRRYTERFVEKREPATQPDRKNERTISRMKFDRRFNRQRFFATSTAFWRGFKWPEFEESFDSIIRDSDKLLQKDVTSTNPSTKEDFVWTAMFTTPVDETENEAPYGKMEENDENMIESAKFYSELSESSTFEESESRKQAATSHRITVKVPEMIRTSHSKTPEFSEHQLLENKVETKMKIEVGTVVVDYSKQTESLLSFSWPDQIQYTTASPFEITSSAKHGNASDESTTEEYTSSKLSTNTIEALNQSSYKMINNSVTERPKTRMQKMKNKAKVWKNFIWPDHQTFTTPKIIESSEVVNTTRMNEQVVESEMKTASQITTTTEKEKRSTKIIEGTNYSPQLPSSSYNTKKLEQQGLVSSTEEHKIETSTNRENFKKTFLFHLRGKSNNTSGSGSERKHFELPFQWPSEEVFENETSEKPISVSGSEEGKKEESVSELTNFKWPEQEKFDFASANTPLTETATFESPNIRKLFTTSSYTSSKPGKSPWGQFQWPEHNLFSYHHIDTEKQKETSSSSTEKWEAEEWGFSLDQDVKDLLEESEKETLRPHKRTTYPSKLTSSPTKATTGGERIELVEDMADFKNVSGKVEEVITKGPMKVSVKHKVNAQVAESEDDEGLWKFRVLEPGEVIKHYKNTIKPLFKFPTIYSFKPIGTPIDEWLQFNEDLQERTVTEPTLSEKTKSTFFIWKTKPIASTESEFDEEIFEEYSTLTPLESTSETTEFLNAETTSESSTSEEYTIPEIITTEKPIFSSQIYDVLSRTEGAALKFNVSSFIRNFMKTFTVKMKSTSVESIKIPTISAEADKEKLASTASFIENIAPLTIGKIIEGEKLGSTESIIENIVPLSISARVEEEKLGSTQSSFENIVPLTISESIEKEQQGSIQSIVENIVQSTIDEIIEKQKLGGTQSIIENTSIVPLSISGRVEEEILGSTQSMLRTFVSLSTSGKVEEERLGSTEPINENILPSTISEKVEEEKVSSSQAITEYIVPSITIERVGEEKLGSTKAVIENILPSTISEKVEEEKVSSSQAITEYIVPSITIERVGEEKLGSTKAVIENILPSTTSAKVEEEKLGRIQTIMENVVPSKYADQEKEDRSRSSSSIKQTTVETTPMTPARAQFQISEEFTESGIFHDTMQPEIQKPQGVLTLNQTSKKIEPEDLNVERTSTTWLFETNYPEYSSRQSDENLMNEGKKLKEYEVNRKFLPEEIYQTTEESIALAEAQSAPVEEMRRSQKPLILFESELGTTVNYFQELKGFEKHFRPTESRTIIYEENAHIKSKIAEEVTVGGEMLTSEQESEVLEDLLTEINQELYSESLKLTGSEFKDKWKYDMNLPRSSEGRYPTELIRTTAEQENIHPKIVHFPYQASTSHGEQLENEIDRGIVHITQKKTEETREEYMQMKEENENNMNHLPEHVLKETSTICQICDEESSYEAGLQIGEISKEPKSTSRRYKLIPVNYNQEGIEINRPVPTKKVDVFIFNQKPATVSPGSTFRELKVPSLREQGTTENVQELTSEKVHAEADKTEMTSLGKYLTVSSTLTGEISELIEREKDKSLTKHGKEGKFLDTVNFKTNTEPVSIENISFNIEENGTSKTEYYSTERTEYQEDIARTSVENTLSTSEYFGQGIVGEHLSTHAEDVFGLETLHEENLSKTSMTKENVLLENEEVSEKSVISRPETLGKKTTNYEFKHPFSSEYNVQTMGERFHSTKPKGNHFTSKEFNVVEPSLTPSIDMMSKSKTTEMKSEKKYKTRTSKITHVEHVQNRLMPMGTTVKKEEYENNMLHLPENKRKETSTLCEVCDSETEYEVGKQVSTSNPKAHKSTRTYETTNTEFEISEPTSGPYHFKGIETGRPLPTERHTVLPFKMYSTSFSELLKLNTASKGVYHSQSLITTARTGTAHIETTLNVPQEISTTTESNTLPKEFITTVEGNMFSMETSNEASQMYFATENVKTTPPKIFPIAEVSQKFITLAEENTVSTEAFSLAEENVATSETFVQGAKPQEMFTAPEEILLETFSTEKVISKPFTTLEENTATFVNEYSQEEFVTTAPINAPSMETLTSEKSLKELITKSEENAASLEIFPNEENLQELITTNAENTASLETYSRQKALQELITAPVETTRSFMNEYSLEELVNTTDINTTLADRISSENTASTELPSQEKNVQELTLTTKETNIAASELFAKETSSQEFVTKPEENIASSVSEYSFEEFVHSTSINTVYKEATSSEKNTQQFITIKKENTAPKEISPHGESSKETITMREENTTYLETYSQETISEEFVTPAEKNVATILNEFSLEELVNSAEMTTASLMSIPSEINTQEVLTIENENISSVEIFPHGTNLQEGMATKEEIAVSLETFSKEKVSQEFITASEGNTAFMNKYSSKELVNTSGINTATLMSLPSEKNTQEQITLQNEKIASVGMFPHEKEWITTKGESTAYSEISLKENISQEFITTPQENTEFVVDKYSLEQFINTAEMNTASLESISTGKNTPELISMEEKKTVSTEITPYEKSLLESTTSLESHSISSETFSKEIFLKDLITISEVNTTSLMNEYSLKEIVNTTEIDTAPVESMSREKITQELITRETENTTSTGVFLHVKNLHDFITSTEGGTVSSETFSGEKLAQESITTPEERITTHVGEYGRKGIDNAAETITTEKINHELITKGEKRTTTTGVFSNEKNFHEFITSTEGGAVSSETFSGEKLLQESITTPEERITTLVGEYTLKEIVNAAETITAEKVTQELITKGEKRTTTTVVFPNEKDFYESITSTEDGTVFSETFSREKLLQEYITIPEERITTFVGEYGLKEIVNATETISPEKTTQELITKGEKRTTTTGVFPHEKNLHEFMTSTEGGIVSSETFSGEKVLQESITTVEERNTTLVGEYGRKEIVNAAETITAPVGSISKETIPQELITKGKKNTKPTGIFTQEKDLHEFSTSKEGGTVPSETFSGGKLLQESITSPEERITSLANDYGLKEIVNTAQIITGPVESISRGKITQELITKGKENITTTGVLPYEKNLHEFNTSTEGGTVSSETFSGEKLLQGSITTQEERITTLVSEYGLKKMVNAEETITAPVESISREKVNQELITKEKENTTPTGILAHEKELHEFITSKEGGTVSSITLSGEKLLQGSNITPEERITSLAKDYGLKEIINTAEIITGPVASISREKITNELTKGMENTTPTGISPHEKSLHELIISKDESTVSSEIFSEEKLLQQSITTPKERIISPVNDYGLEEIVNTAMNTSPVELISSEKITEELITKGMKNNTPPGIFPHGEELSEFITSNKESTFVSSQTISAQKLLQESITTPEERITSPVNEFGFQTIVEELITIQKETITPLEIFPHEKTLHKFITSEGESTPFAESVSNEETLQQFSTTFKKNITFVNEAQNVLTTAEVKTFSNEKSLQGSVTTTGLNISFVDEFSIQNITKKFNITPHTSTVAKEILSHENDLEEFIVTTERNIASTEGLSKVNVPQEITTIPKSITASIETFFNGEITAARTSNEKIPQESDVSFTMKPVFTEKFSSEKTNTETVREELYETEIVGQSVKPAIFERVTEKIFTPPTPNVITTELRKNMISKPKNLNRISNDHFGSEISTKHLDENKIFFTSLSKKSTTENEGKTSLKSNLVRKEWPNEIEDDFEMLHLPHVERYETSTLCEICSEPEDVQMTTIQELQFEGSSGIEFQSIAERVSVRTNKEVYDEKMPTKQIEHEEEYEGNMLNLPRKEQEDTSTLCEICDEETKYESLEHISSKKAEFYVELATSLIGRPEISESSLPPYRFTGIEINRPIPTQNLNIVPLKINSTAGTDLSNAKTPKIKEITASTEASSEEKAIPLIITEESLKTEHGGQSTKLAYTIPEDINIKPVIPSTVNEEEIVTKFHSKEKLGTISDEYIGSSVTKNLNIYSPVNTSEQKESEDDYEILQLPQMNQHETSTICEICEEVENIQTSKPQLFTFRKASKPKSYVSTEIASKHVEEENASSENFDYIEESNMLKLPESGKDETSTLCEICDEEAGTFVSTMKTVLFEDLDTSKYEFISAEQESITNTDGVGRVIINRPIPTQNVNILPFNVHSTMFNAFTNTEDEFLFQNFLAPPTELHNLIQPHENVASESVSEVLQETEVIDQSEQPYIGLPLLSPGVLDDLESSRIPQFSSPNELTSPFYVKEIDSDLYTQSSSEQLKEEFKEDLLTKVFDKAEFSKISLLSALSEFTPPFEIEGETETIFETRKSEEMTLESVDEILHADESVYYSKQPYDGGTLLPSDLTEDLNVHTQASSEETKNEITEDLLTKVLDENGFSRISSPNEFTPPLEDEGEAETIVDNVKSEKVTLEADDEILHADESVYYSKQPYDGVTLLPSELTEDLNVHAQASSEETKNEITEDLLTKVLDDNGFSRISSPNEFTPLLQVEEEAETIYHNAKPEEVTLESVDEILHADETVDHSKKPYIEGTILPSDSREDINVDTQASPEELKAESTEDLLTKVLDETEFLEISLPSSLDEFTTQLEIWEAEKMFKNAKPEDLASKSVDEILHESEIVNLSKPYGGITILPADLLEIGSDSNLYTQTSTEEVKVEFTEDLLTKVLDENEIPQITPSLSLDEVAAQLQVEETEKMIPATSKNLQSDQYKTTTIPHYDHILKTQTLSTTEKVLETSTQSAEITISQKLDLHEHIEEVHLVNEPTEYRKTESITTPKLDTEENLLITSMHHTIKPEMHQPVTYKFEGIKIDRPVPTENTNVFLFKMLPTTEPNLCKFGEEVFPYEKNISSTHKSSLHLESSSVKSPTSEMKELHESGQINGTGTGYENLIESFTITDTNTPIYSELYALPTTELKIFSEINKTNFALLNIEHVMKQQSSTMFFLKTSENIPEVKGHTISAYESPGLELTNETVPLKEEEAMAVTQKEVSKKFETYGSMMSSSLSHHTSEMIKHDKHVSIEENIKEEFRVTQEAYTPSFLSEAVEFKKDMTSHNSQSSEISIQSTFGMNETIENEIEKQFVEENFGSSTMHAEEKSTEVVSSRDELLIPKELNEKLESLGGVVSEIFTSTFPSVHNMITVEREFQTINMETDILENELKELNVDFSEMLATTMPSDIMLQRLEEIMEPSGSNHLGTKTESVIHSSQYISSNSELLSASKESIKNTLPEISETKSTQTFNPVENKALSETITEWSDAMVEKLLVPLTAEEESEMKNYSLEINLPTTIFATEVTVMEHEFLSASTNISGKMYKPDVILSKEEELLLTTFPEQISEAKFLATSTDIPISKTSRESIVEQYEWENKGSPSESQLLIETEAQLERETSPKYTLLTETPMMELEIFSQSPNTLEELYTSSAIASEGETLYTPYITQSNTEENFLATLHEEGNVKVSAFEKESVKYSSEEELSGKIITNMMESEISSASSNTQEGSHYAHTSSLWQKETETEYSTESELKESFLASLIEEGHAKDYTKTTTKEEGMKYFSEEVTERTITNIIDHEISPTRSSPLEVFHLPVTGSSQQKESETEYSTESEERLLATLIEGGHAKVPTKTTRKDEGMKYFSEGEGTEKTITNIMDHEMSSTPLSTLEALLHPITGSSPQKESEIEYLTKLNSEEIMLGTLVENETSSLLTNRTTEGYRTEEMKGFSESQLLTEGKSETKQSPEEYISSIESTIMQHSEAIEDHLSHYSSSSLTEPEATKTEYLTELNSDEIMLATLVENQTTEITMRKTGGELDFLTDLEETTTVGLYTVITSELPAENISETSSEEVFLNTLFEEEKVNISIGNQVFSVETTVKHGDETSTSSSILEGSYNHSAFSTEHEQVQTENLTKMNSEESFLATLVESEVTKFLPENTSEKPDYHRKDTISKSTGVEKISGIPLLTTLLLSLVASSTQHPETNQMSGHYKINAQDNQTFPKCLVVFFTGENASNPMISLNGTKWIPSHEPFIAEGSTTSSNESLSQMSQLTENTSHEANSATTELSEDETSEETETTSTVQVTTEEIIDTSNFVQGGCTEADFENNNNCFCMLDLTIDHVSGEIQASNSSNLNKVECSTFLKVNTGLIIKDEKAPAKRKKRSYLYLKYHNKKKREIVEYNKLDEVLANELVPSNGGGAIYSAVGASVSIPCVYNNEVVEREHFTRYVWTSFENKAVPLSERVRETTDGVLKISDVAVKDGGNYTCSVNRPFGTTDSEHERFQHELMIVERPIFKIQTTIMYNTEETCSLKHGDIIHNHLPKLLEELLCGLHKRVCRVEMERPNCVAMEDNTYLSFKYVVSLDALPTLIPSLTYEKCDFDCQMKIYGSLISLLIKNVETINFLNIVSEMKTSNHTFKPREIKFPTDRKTVEDTTLFPMLLIGCPPGFGIQQKNNKICVACPRDYYSADNSSSCVPCPFIHFQPNLGSTDCLECRTPFEDKSCVGMVLANRSFLIIYIGSSVAIIFLILLCVFCAQSVGTPAKKKKNTQTPKRRRIGRRDIEDPAEKTMLLKDTASRKVIKGPKVPPPDFY